jgi:hypothetical protein
MEVLPLEWEKVENMNLMLMANQMKKKNGTARHR